MVSSRPDIRVRTSLRMTWRAAQKAAAAEREASRGETRFLGETRAPDTEGYDATSDF